MAKQIKKHGKLALVLGLILILVVIYLVIPSGQAATISSRKMTLTDSRPSSGGGTGVRYAFTGTHTASNVQCLLVEFCDAASGACSLPSGMSTAAATATTTDWANWTAASWQAGFATTATGFKYTWNPGESGGASYAFAAANIDNPDAGTSYARISTYNNVDCASSGVDSGTVAFATIAGVTVSATVSETLTFSVNAVTAANCPNYDNGGAPNEVDTTATTVPFSTVTVETFYDACQDLRVATNAGSGYSTTIQETDQLTSGADQIADGTCDGGCTDSAEADWATATNNGFGYCMDDQGGYGVASATADGGWGTNGCDDADTYFKTIADAGAAETAQAIMSSAAEVSDDRSFVGFRLSVDTVQAAGTNTNTIVYITTPTY